MFCDHGADIDNTLSSAGLSPLMYAATKSYDEICMYLSLRATDVDIVDEKTGKNVFAIYLARKDLTHMKQLVMRGANVNYCNKRTGQTPLHAAISMKLNSKVVKFLLKNGANPHVENNDGFDCCDLAIDIERYAKIKVFKS